MKMFRYVIEILCKLFLVLLAGWISALVLLIWHVIEMLCKPVFLVLLAGWISALVLLIWLGYRRYKRVYQTKWYDLSKKGPNEEMEWYQIRQLMERDPMRYQCSYRSSQKYIRSDIFKFIVLIDILGFMVPVLILSDSSFQNWDAKDSVAVGVLALVVSVATIFYNVRLKSRTENRQAWINSIRTEISDLIAAFPSPQASDYMINTAFLEIQQNLTKLELYLNPSERVHRGLMAAIRFMYGFEGIDVDKEASDELRLPRKQYPWRNQNTASARNEWLKWKTKSIRLANVLLKREWERVKHIK